MTSLNETTISIPKDLADKLKERAENNKFNSLSNYVTYILRQVLSNIEMNKKAKKEAFTKEDEEKVKEKLRSMGYLE